MMKENSLVLPFEFFLGNWKLLVGYWIFSAFFIGDQSSHLTCAFDDELPWRLADSQPT